MTDKPLMPSPVSVQVAPLNPEAIEQAIDNVRAALEQLDSAGFRLRCAAELKEGDVVLSHARAEYTHACHELLSRTERALRLA